MAYPTVSAPYGLTPVNLIGGQPYAGAVRHIPILAAYTTAIGHGDAVKMVTTGTLERDAGTTACTPVGVFLGCSYVDPNGTPVESHYWPGTASCTDIVAKVADDPDLVMKIALVSGTTVVAPYTRAEIVAGNLEVVSNTLNTTTGNSKIAANGATADTTVDTLPLRVIDVVEETKDSNGEYVECLVKWNVGHQYLNTTGLA